MLKPKVRIDNNIYTSKEGFYAWPQFRLLGIFIIGYTFVNIYNYGLIYYGTEIIAIGVGALLNLMITGYQIDFSKKLHRVYVSIGHYCFGKWIPLQDPDYVTVFVTNVVRTWGSLAVRLHDKYQDVRVSVINKSNERYEVGGFSSKVDAFRVGRICASKLNIRLLDYTEREPKWVNFNNDVTDPA